MGCCCSCGGGEDEATSRETELATQRAASKSLTVSVKMSAPTIKVEQGGDNSQTVSGRGLAVVAVPLEQDAAYWEWRISLPARKHVDTVMFGVTSMKDRKFYEELKGKEPVQEGEFSEQNGTAWMRKVEVQNGDVVGVAIQQSDLPMVQFFHNGEPLHELAVNRFRGTAYPSIFLTETAEKEDMKVALVVAEDQFEHMSPAAKFGPIIVARSIV